MWIEKRLNYWGTKNCFEASSVKQKTVSDSKNLEK